MSCFEESLNAKHERVQDIAGLHGARSGIRMPNIMIDELFLMIIIAGFGLSIAYLRAVHERRMKRSKQRREGVKANEGPLQRPAEYAQAALQALHAERHACETISACASLSDRRPSD